MADRRSERSREAGRRSRHAAQRLIEVRTLLERLRAGGRLSEADLSLAQQRAQESATWAAVARTRSVQAHHRAADAHRAAAALATSGGHAVLADHHERAALVDDDAARAEGALVEDVGRPPLPLVRTARTLGVVTDGRDVRGRAASS
jgi:hypothetical protein